MSSYPRISATVAAFFCMSFGMSAIYVGSLSVFLGPVSASMGWGVSVFTLVFTVSAYIGAFSTPFSGRLIDRVGVRIPVTIGIATFALGLFGLSRIHSTGFVFWASAVCIGIGAALAGPVAHVRVVSSWWDTNRALALGLVVAVAPSLSQSLVAPVARWLIDAFGWRTAYEVLAAAVLVVGCTSALFFLKVRSADTTTDSPAAVTPVFEGVPAKRAYRSRTFWTLTAAECLATSSLIGTQAHMVHWFTGRGVTGATATFLVSLMAVSGMVGVLFSGSLTDRIRSHRVAAVLYTLPAISLALLLAAGSTLWMLGVGVVLMGCALTAVTLLLPYLVTRYFGLRASAEIFGISLACSMLSIGTGPTLIGIGFDTSGSYMLPISLAVAATTVSALLMFSLKPYIYAVVKPAPRDAGRTHTVPGLTDTRLSGQEATP
ncbi:MFS family permease [Streptomyces sp. SAI-149]|uniref:MFS transporter n=2 Tax=unclassified Streptomyces TaxID=2593676 RepID=UPI00247D083C|nr:MFS family permease [Streptomyces sp. SAI-119]MDH6495190.1 MFS family permease [Streptomyces sp. SAI-149]